jgi:hypothetical protein
MNPELEFCKRTNPIYQDIRNRHYIPNNGTHGQQIHFLIHYNHQVVGIISGASSVYGVSERDKFFRIPSEQKVKQKLYLPAIVNNVVFRLEYHEPNLGTKVLSKWRKAMSEFWEEIYGVPVIGFETFIVETDTRKGSMYKADNWTFVGQTKGSTKKHNGLQNKGERLITDIKLTYCRWKDKPVVPTVEYVSSWRTSTDEEKARAKSINLMKESLVGVKL